MKVAIIGGGLAGNACAYILKEAGATPVIYEAGPEIAPGASGNATGLYNPRFTAEKNAESEYFSSAFFAALRMFGRLENIGWNACGALHLMADEKKQKRFPETVKNWGWTEDAMRLVSPGEASQIAGVEIRYEALYLPQSGTVSPQKLCAAYARDIEIRFNHKVEDLQDVKADAVILACASGMRDFAEMAALPVKTVRGQITQARATAQSEKLRCCVCYGGYVTPAENGVHTIGATFQRWLDHDNILPADDAENLAKLDKAVPRLTEGMAVAGQRAALRLTTPDYMPLAGKVADGLYISTAHGSHGILSTLMSAQLLADMILQRSLSLSAAAVERLSPARFYSL